MINQDKQQLMDIARQESWIKTPFSYVKLGNKLTLLQQDAMLMVSANIQQYIKNFYDLGMNKSNKNPIPLFAKHLLENGIPGFKIMLADMGINTANYKVTREAIEEMNLLVEIPEFDENGERTGGTIFAPVFKKFRVPPTGDMYRKKDNQGDVIVESARHCGYIEVEINNDVAQYVFNMRQGYVNHPKLIARYASKRSTPRLYFKLQELMGKEKHTKVKCTVQDIKNFLGFETFKDEKTGEWVVPYAKFAHFKTKVLDAVQQDLDQMAKEDHTDITFTYVPVYLNGRKRGDPDFIEFTITSTELGQGYSLLTGTDTPATDEAKERRREAVEQDIFAEEAQDHTQQDYDAGAGEEQWRQLLADYDGPAKSLMMRAKYLGLQDGAFLIHVSEEDNREWQETDDSDLQRLGRKLMALPEFMPSVRRTVR